MSFYKHDMALVHDKAFIGENTRVWAFTNIQEGAVIGKGCNVCDGCYVEKGAVIGDHVTLKNHVAVFDGVTLEDDVFIGACTVFINDKYPRANREDKFQLVKTVVKKGATLGAGSIILCGVSVGQYAVIGAGSVVTKNVPDHAVFVGNPAQFKGHACRCGRMLDKYFRCVCGRQYHLKSGMIQCDE